MSTLEAIRIALQSLWANKLRSVLTLLGVVIGVAAVIAVVTFVNGINGYVSEKIFNLGADVFIVAKVTPVITNVDQYLEGLKRKDMTLEDYEAVRDGCIKCRYVGATTFYANGHVNYGEHTITDTWVRGFTPSMLPILDTEIVLGRPLNETDMSTAAPVAIIGQDIVDNVLPSVDPVGKEIHLDVSVYTVIGIGNSEGKTLGQSRDNYVIIPITAWQRQYGSRVCIRIVGKAYGVDHLSDALDEARVIMRSRRHDAPGHPDSFAAETNESFLSLWTDLSSNFFIAMVAIASISLVLGGIVIMNIMLVSVTERTREIGIRKALGARRLDVLRQFLIESSTMALVGGLIGVLFGVAIAKTVTLLIGMPSGIKLWAVLAGLAVAVSVGFFFGVYPARKAARLDPIAALRFEL